MTPDVGLPELPLSARVALARSTLAALLALALLAAWAFAAPHTCLALAVPVALLAVLTAGAAGDALAYRRHRAGFYFPESGRLYRLAGGGALTVLVVALPALVYTLSLTAFAALGDRREWLVLALCALASTVTLPWLRRVVAPRVAPPARAFVVKRLLAWCGFLPALSLYLAIMLSSMLPAYLVPGSLLETLDAASATVSSRCAFTDFALKLARELEALQWFFAAQGSTLLPTVATRALGWGVFLLYSGLALMGMGRFCAEVAGFLCRLDRDGRS